MFNSGQKKEKKISENIMKVWTAKRLWQQLEKSVLVKINVHSIEQEDEETEMPKRAAFLEALLHRIKAAKTSLLWRSKDANARDEGEYVKERKRS